MMMTVMVTVMMCSVTGGRSVPLPHQADDEGGSHRRQARLASGLWVSESSAALQEQIQQNGEWKQLSGRVMDLWSKGLRFESWQEWRENVLLQGQPSVLTLMSVSILRIFFLVGKPSVLTVMLVSVPPPYYHSSTKDPGHSAQSAGGRLQLNTHAHYIRMWLRMK